MINIVCDSIHFGYLEEDLETQIHDGEYRYLKTFSICAFLEVFAVLGFIYAKEPEDCFRCFNRLPNLKYSTWSGEIRKDSAVFLPSLKDLDN